jgi:Flp pilus assembly protein TadD
MTWKVHSGNRGGACLLAFVTCALASAHAGSTLADARALYNAKHYAEARALLEPLVAADPSNAAAAYALGMTYVKASPPSALDDARLWLGKAVKLAPEDENYLSDYAGVCLLLADRDSSFSMALEGRDAMTRAIAANPDDIEAREGLMRFYAKAPWPLGDVNKALLMAAEIAKRDPKKGAAEYTALAATLTKEGHSAEADMATKAAQSLAPGHGP